MRLPASARGRFPALVRDGAASEESAMQYSRADIPAALGLSPRDWN